tara:strand:+ start:167 stop:373 length:207 start_codon:yes stop_codon:yes gene_type:complete
MYVLERSGVTWDARFYSGHSMSGLLANFSSLDCAKRFNNRSDAEAEKDRLDRETGIYTMVTNTDDFGV